MLSIIRKKIFNQTQGVLPPIKFAQSAFFKEFAKLSPIKLVDIGARGGAPANWNPVFDNLKVFCFEPDKKECEKLNKETNENHTFFPYALFNKDEEIDFNMTKKPDCSSIYKPNRKFLERFPNSHLFDVEKIIKVKCATLDNVLKDNRIHDIDFIKVDTQGSELQVLEGAKETLQESVLGVEVEIEFSPQYENQPFFSEVDQYLRKLGFSLFDIRLVRLKRINSKHLYSKGGLCWGNAVYLKDFLQLKNISKAYSNKTKAIKSLAIAELYGFPDFALELMDFYKDSNVISDSLVLQIRKILEKDRRSDIMQLILDMGYRLSKYIRNKSNPSKWHVITYP